MRRARCKGSVCVCVLCVCTCVSAWRASAPPTHTNIDGEWSRSGSRASRPPTRLETNCQQGAAVLTASLADHLFRKCVDSSRHPPPPSPSSSSSSTATAFLTQRDLTSCFRQRRWRRWKVGRADTSEGRSILSHLVFGPGEGSPLHPHLRSQELPIILLTRLRPQAL